MYKFVYTFINYQYFYYNFPVIQEFYQVFIFIYKVRAYVKAYFGMWFNYFIEKFFNHFLLFLSLFFFNFGEVLMYFFIYLIFSQSGLNCLVRLVGQIKILMRGTRVKVYHHILIKNSQSQGFSQLLQLFLQPGGL